jgi:hypothetical protein
MRMVYFVKPAMDQENAILVMAKAKYSASKDERLGL